MAKKAKVGRPSISADQRRTAALGFRPTPAIRQWLEQEAANNLRSLSAEIESRLEQSRRDEAALIETLGGKETYGILRVLGSVAAHIQTRTGKTPADWKTGVAIGRGWKRLITDWVKTPPAEWIAELRRLRHDILDAPEPPEAPTMPATGGLLYPRASEEEWEAYEADRKKFLKDVETFKKAAAEYKNNSNQLRLVYDKKCDEFNKAVEIGDEEALGLLSDRAQ
jgi:hypothetical protein